MGNWRPDDTIVALSSGRPPAAIGVIRCSGPAAVTSASALIGSLPPARTAGLRRLVDPTDGRTLDDALVIVLPGPGSATGEDIVELHCHGGRATIDAVLGALSRQPGCRLAEPGEFTRRALANGRIDLTEAEGLADLLAAETELQRRSALARAGGAFRQQLDNWRDRILRLAAAVEVAIDYADEEDGSALPDLSGEIEPLIGELSRLLDAPPVEPLRDGIRVVISGPPNVGKSSVINALAQSDRAIVTDVPGTTRDAIEVPVSIGGIPYVLVDTAGLRESGDIVEAIGVRRAMGEVERADILLWMGDASDSPADAILLAGKCDLDRSRPGLAISPLTGEGMDRLIGVLQEAASALLPKGDELAIDRRHRALANQARSSLQRALALPDPVLVAEELRAARAAIDAITGRAGVEDLLDVLFSRFCLGK